MCLREPSGECKGSKRAGRLWLILLALPALTCQTITGAQSAASQGASAASDPSPYPTPPPTARIAFVATGWSVPGADREIFVMNPDGTGVTPITNSRERDEDPSWSFDGRKIAFLSCRDGNYEVYVMNADGSHQTRVTNTPEDEHYPSWSPDGSQIVFSRLTDGLEDLYVINVDGTGLNSSDGHCQDQRALSGLVAGRKAHRVFLLRWWRCGDLYNKSRRLAQEARHGGSAA